MINPKELRIGNWIYINNKPRFVTSAILAEIDQGELEAEPVPLTEDMVLQVGFKKWGDNLTYNKGSFIIHYRKRKDEYVIRRTFRAIKSLHHLQNIYYFSTFEELNIQLW